MGKVWDALRRADAERGRRVAEVAAPALPEWTPAPAGAEPRRRALGRWFTRRRHAAGDVEQDAGTSANKRRIALLQPDSYVAEQFRTLRGRIDSIGVQRPVRTIAVTSALPAEGKTTAAINLAIVTSMSVGRRVLLMDCDLRTPTVHRSLGLVPKAGLAEILTEQAGLDQSLLKVERLNLEVLPVHALPPNPSELLASDRMRSLLEEAARSFDRVILDTPPALGLPDAKTLSELCDGIVMVVRADTTQEDDVQASLDVIDRRRVLGVLLNGTRMESRYGRQA